jgi:hypothetical protein
MAALWFALNGVSRHERERATRRPRRPPPGRSPLAGRYDLPGFLAAVMTIPNGAAFTVSQLVIGSQGA